jgi:hypothetical protein
MWFLIGVSVGAGLAGWLMKHLFDQGWVRSKWYDEYVDRVEKGAASGEFVAGRFP